MLFSFLQRNKADVILLQETHSCFDDENFWQNEWGGKIVFLMDLRLVAVFALCLALSWIFL